MSARIPHEAKQKKFGSRGHKTMNFPRKTTLAAAVSAALLSGTAAQAQIGCSDIPGNQASAFIAGPTNPNNGFAEFVTDENNLALELCLDAANCFFDPVIQGSLFSEQIGFGAEAFWWLAEAVVDTRNNGGISAIITMATEAAFLVEEPADGDQFPFTRLRIRLDVPATGVYTVTHPYGTETFVVDALIDGQEVRTSFDIGFANDAQNQGCVGPWLQWDTGAPPGFIGDGTTPHAVIGSPTGNNLLTISAVDLNGNALNIDGQGNSSVSTNLFTVSGKLYDGTPATPMTARRSSYERTADASTAQLDVFARAAKLATVEFDDGNGGPTPMISGASDSRSSDSDSANFLGSKILEGPAVAVPATVAVNATDSGTDATRLLRRVTDVVSITQAEYDAASSMLTIRAESSDASVTPVLTTAEYPNETLPMTMFTLAPPATINVISSHGGSDEAQVLVVDSTFPTANDDIAETDEDSAVLIDVKANDTSILSSTIDIIGPPTLGSAVVVSDSIEYTPLPNWNGATTLAYRLTNSEGIISNTAIVTVTVNPVNDAPVAVDDLAATDSETAIDIAVLANDTDIDGDLLSIDTVDPVSALGGTLTINGNLVSYTPPNGASGNDTFSYTASDGNGGTDTALVTVSLTVAGNEPPTAAPDTATVDEDSGANSIDVLANDIDPDGDALTIIDVVQPTAGGTVNTDGSLVTFTPSVNFSGSTSFTYSIDDGNGNLAEGAVNVTVNPVNDPPVAVDDSATTEVDAPILIAVLGNDSDVDGDALSISALDVTSAAGGNLAISGSSVSYTPPAGFEGADTFSYTASDGLLSDSAFVTVTVNRPPQPAAYDVDIRSISGQNGRLGRTGTASVSATIRLTLVTPPAGLQPLAITLVGQHSNGEPQYLNTRTIVIDPGVTSYTLNNQDFPAYTTTAAGTITWTVSFDDADADIDMATAISTIR